MRPQLLLIATVLAASGCQPLAERVFTTPEVTFSGVEVRTLGLRGGVVDVLLRVRNPNRFRLTAERSSYRLLVLDSVEVASGETTTPVAVAANDTATVRLPLDITWKSLGAVGRAVAGSGTVEYRIVGSLDAAMPIGTRTIPFDEKGRFAAIKAGI